MSGDIFFYFKWNFTDTIRLYIQGNAALKPSGESSPEAVQEESQEDALCPTSEELLTRNVEENQQKQLQDQQSDHEDVVNINSEELSELLQGV